MPHRNDKELMARVDTALEGWYRAVYDPRIISPSLAELVGLRQASFRHHCGSVGI